MNCFKCKTLQILTTDFLATLAAHIMEACKFQKENMQSLESGHGNFGAGIEL